MVAGTSFGLTATIVDAFGNLESADSGRSVSVSAASPVAPFPVSATTSGGVATFDPTVVTTAGGYVLTGASAGLSDGAAGLTVLADSASDRLAVTSAPSAPVAAGTAFPIGISVRDQYGNVDPSAAVPVQLASTPVVAGLPTTVVTSGGTAGFGPFTLTVPGSYMFAATSSGLSGANVTVTVTAGAAAAIVVTGIADEGTSPALPHPVVGKPFDTTVQFRDAYGNPAHAGAGVTITLSRTTGTGTVGGTVSTAVATGASSATIAGSTYSALENAVVLQVGATAGGPLTPGTITTDVAGQAATVTGTPNVTIPPITSLDPVNGQPCVLTATQTTCSQLVLPKGALGPVYLYQTVCDNGCKTGGGTTAQIVYGTADLTDGSGHPLYTRSKPATMVFSCYSKLCPHPDPMPPGQLYDLHELKEDVAANPLEFTVFLPGSKTQTFTGIATVCAKTGIVDAGKYFCIDPKKSIRDSKKNYIVYVLFIGDPHGRITCHRPSRRRATSSSLRRLRAWDSVSAAAGSPSTGLGLGQCEQDEPGLVGPLLLAPRQCRPQLDQGFVVTTEGEQGESHAAGRSSAAAPAHPALGRATWAPSHWASAVVASPAARCAAAISTSVASTSYASPSPSECRAASSSSDMPSVRRPVHTRSRPSSRSATASSSSSPNRRAVPRDRSSRSCASS